MHIRLRGLTLGIFMMGWVGIPCPTVAQTDCTVSVAPANATLTVGEAQALVATVAQADCGTPTFDWSSSDTSVATVTAGGEVHAVAPGSTTITASFSGRSATAAITVRAPVLPYSPGGLVGHIYSVTQPAPPQFSYGISFYTTISQLTAEQAQSAQLGWGAWTMPDNNTFDQPLCPVGTFARDHWPERGPYYRDVFQTLEGGAGQWTDNHFPGRTPKFRINSTPDCYTNLVASPGWSFYGSPLPADKLGLVQLSNRVLYPPDGLPMVPEVGSALLGYGWLALPLVPAYTLPNGLAVGDQSWTLFLTAANFMGPVAFFAPEGWETVAAVDRTGAGRGMDALPSFTGSAALEIGNLPHFTGQDSAGVRYRRLPRLTFPTNGTTETTLLQDVRLYAKNAAWDGFATWIQGGAPLTQFTADGTFNQTLSGAGQSLSMDQRPVDITGVMSSAIVNVGGGTGLGLRWTAPSLAGVVPEYYREDATGWTAVAPSEVPRTTWLADQAFPPAPTYPFPALDLEASSPWQSSGWSAGPFTRSLDDGSVVDYVWYRFVDQPAIARLGLDANQRAELQRFVEGLHRESGLNGVSVAPPAGDGHLATIDPGAIVTPPEGLTAGFVPIVIRQFQDTAPPVIGSHPDITAEAAGPAGVVVGYTSPTTIDNVDGQGTASCLPGPGTLFALGSTRVTCTATDAHGNAATPTTFTVIVRDTTPPLAACAAVGLRHDKDDGCDNGDHGRPGNLFRVTGSDAVGPLSLALGPYSIANGSIVRLFVARRPGVIEIAATRGTSAIRRFRVGAADAFILAKDGAGLSTPASCPVGHRHDDREGREGEGHKDHEPDHDKGREHEGDRR